MTKRAELLLHHGGLMRCCLDSLQEWVREAPQAEAKPGERIECKHEHKPTMIVDKSGAFVRWGAGTKGGT